jgi:ABC-type multidrug transport system fused ATPase/permease subunit
MSGSKGTIRKVISLLAPGERRRLWIVAFGSIFTTLVEAIGIGSIMPFMTVASKPSIIQENGYLRQIFGFFKFNNETSFLIFLGVCVLGLLIVTNVSQALLHYIKVRFTSMRRHTLSMRLLTAYLRQAFVYFLNKNSYDFVKNINTEIGQMINTTLMQLVEFISRVIQVTLLLVFLVLVNPTSTLLIAVAIIGMYGLIYAFVKKTLRRLGTERFELNTERSRIVSEAFWGINEIKIAASEKEIVNEFTQPSIRLARNETISVIISDVPKFALETAAFSAIVGYVLIMILRSGGFRDAAGAITLFAYAGYRLIPAIQALFRSLTQLRYGATTAHRIASEFESTSGGGPLVSKRPERIAFKRVLELQNVEFSYPNMDAPVIPGLSLQIPANSLTGFAGKTGSGKTTLVDIIMGLLAIQGGSILIDGVRLNEENVRSWQANLGYVPQSIYLSNDTIAANIAFGVNQRKISMEAVVNAGKLSQLHDFVQQGLKGRYETKVGERGIRLSGGQKQRIGIARALYRDPSVLIMDEATSALDNHTERAVMEAIDTLQGTRTIILIAHRLSTLRKCDVIYLLDKGRIIDSGVYEELAARNKYFSAD